MRALLALVVSVSIAASAVACVVPSLGIGKKSADTTDAGAASTDGGASATTVQGASCTQLSTSESVCAYISACPDLTLDAKRFPHCGFRIHGSVIDMECWCVDTLCPIGVATTCAAATRLLSSDQNEDTVCLQANEGRCTGL